MRISLLSADVFYPLAGEAGVAESVHSSAADVRIEAGISTQVARRVRATTAANYDRANLLTTLSFSTVRTFSTVAIAEKWAADYDAAFPRTGSLWLYPTGGADADIRQLAGVVVAPPERQVLGCSVLLRYACTGGAISELTDVDVLALAYFAANTITDPVSRERITAALIYLRGEELLPDDAVFLRTGQQPSAMAPKTLMGLTGASAGTPVMAAGGLTYDGNDSSYWTLADPVTEFTVVSDIRGVTSGQTAIGALIQLTNSVDPNSTAQMLTYTEAGAARAYSLQSGSGANSDNTNVGTVSAPTLLDNWSAFECVAGYSYDGAVSPTIQIAIDGIMETVDSTGMVRSTSALDRLVLAGQQVGGSSFGLQSKVRIGAAMIYSRVLSDAEFITVTRAVCMLDPRRIQLLALGDSLSTNVGTAERAGDNWPIQFGVGTSWDSYLRVRVAAQNGKKSLWGVSNYGVSVTPWKADGTVCDESAITILFGTNDVYSGTESGAVIAARILDIVAAAKADGFYVILISCPPFNPSMAVGIDYTAGQIARWNDLHDAQVADQGLADGFVNLSEIDVIGEGVDEFWFDKYHFNAAGNKMISERVAALLPWGSVSIPRCTARPTVSGTLTSGSVLTATTGTWANSPTGYTYQWYREATAISGAMAATRTLAAGDVGHRLFCRVTATNAAGESQTASTNLTGTIS